MKKILVVGSSAKEYALIQKLKTYECEIIVAPGNERIAEIAQCIDIREEKTKELLEFVLENAVDLTIATSQTAIKNDIAGLFQANGQMIFSPTVSAGEITYSRSACKKFLYKLRIPSVRFGIFEKPQMAFDYLKNAQMPQVIRTDESSNSYDRLVCTTFSSAKTFVEDLFNRGETKVVLEDYVYGHEFTLYVITDGYNAIPLTAVANYKFMEDGDGGILTPGAGAFTPDYKISQDILSRVMKNVVNNVLSALERRGTPYVGILGVDCVLADDKVIALDFKSFLSDHDSQAVLNLTEENLITLFEACAVGSFADDYETLKISDNSAVSCVIFSKTKDNVINGLDNVESDITFFPIKKNEYLEYLTVNGRNFVLTRTAKTLSRARTLLYEDIDGIDFAGKKYRTDICLQVENF